MMQQRKSFRATCPDYNQAKSCVKRCTFAAPYVWLEAQTLSADMKVWPARPDDIAYGVHASSDARDIPAFAIEVYEHGALARYETEHQKILDYAKMNESDRVQLIRSQSAKNSNTNSLAVASAGAHCA